MADVFGAGRCPVMATPATPGNAESRVRRPWLLDLFCGAGGAAKGYHDAGFDVLGVDIEPQPDYPYPFVQGDALDIGRALLATERFAAAHASPPCQAHTSLRSTHPDKAYPDYVAVTRALLVESGLPYVIENVPGAPLRAPLTLCGTEFGLVDDGWWLKRHRLFESNVPLLDIGRCCCTDGRRIAGIYGHSDGPVYKPGRKGWSVPSPMARRLLRTPWITNRNALAQAIPPAYTEHLGRQLVEYLIDLAASRVSVTEAENVA